MDWKKLALLGSILLFFLLPSLPFSQQQCSLGEQGVFGVPDPPSLSTYRVQDYNSEITITNWGECITLNPIENGPPSFCQLSDPDQDSGKGCRSSICGDDNQCNGQERDACQRQQACTYQIPACVENQATGLYSPGTWYLDCHSARNQGECTLLRNSGASCVWNTDIIYEFRWTVFSDGGQSWSTLWAQGLTPKTLTCSQRSGCSSLNPIYGYTEVRACNGVGCTDPGRSQRFYYGDWSTLPPELSEISPQFGDPDSVFSITATAPEQEEVDPVSLEWNWAAGESVVSTGSVNNPAEGEPIRLTLDCVPGGNPRCPEGSQITFSARLRYGAGYSEWSTAQARVADPGLPTPGISISPSPARKDQAIQATFAIQNNDPSPQTLNFRWVSEAGETFSTGTRQAGPGQIQAILDCPSEEECAPGTRLTLYANLEYEGGGISPEASASVEIREAQEGAEERCGNGAWEQDEGELCDPSTPRDSPDGCGEGQRCNDYCSACMSAEQECDNGICEGTESVSCPEDCADENDTTGLIHIGFMIISVLIALAYMYSRFIGEVPYLEVWMRDEAGHLLFSILFAGLLLGGGSFLAGSNKGFLADANNVAGQFLGLPPNQGGGASGMFSEAQEYLNSLSNSGIKEIERLTEGSLQNQLKATDYLFVGIPLKGGKGEGKKANLRAASQSQELAIDLLIPMLISIRMQEKALSFISTSEGGTPLISSMLAIGLLLRLIPFTRTGGNLVLAGAFSLYIILPAMYVLFSNIHSQIIADPENLGFPSLSDPYLRPDKFSSIIPQAVFLPNLAIVIVISSTMSISHAIKVITER